MKKFICLGLFLLPLLGMIAVLMNYSSPVKSTYVDANGNTVNVQLPAKKEKAVKTKKLTSSKKEDNSLLETITPQFSDEDKSDSEWITRKINGISTSYKLERDFKNCNVNAKTLDAEKKAVAALAHTNRANFLKTILEAHCIDYSNADISQVDFADVNTSDTKTKQIIKTAIDLGIAKWYNDNGRKTFKPGNKISKVEALAILLNLSWLQLKDKAPENHFNDVEKNWKSNVADTSYRLQLTPIDNVKNLFYPDYVMKKADTYDMLKKVSRYY